MTLEELEQIKKAMMDYITLTAEQTVNRALDRINGMIGDAIQQHKTVCMSEMPANIRKAFNGSTNGEKIRLWLFKHWHYIVLCIILLWIVWAVERGVMTPEEVNDLINQRLLAK